MVDKPLFLLDNIEVVKTGRTATRKLKNSKVDERIEICPAHSANGSWKKWVRENDLFTIEEYNV